jgi:hypothetical protein
MYIYIYIVYICCMCKCLSVHVCMDELFPSACKIREYAQNCVYCACMHLWIRINKTRGHMHMYVRVCACMNLHLLCMCIYRCLCAHELISCIYTCVCTCVRAHEPMSYLYTHMYSKLEGLCASLYSIIHTHINLHIHKINLHTYTKAGKIYESTHITQ